MKLDSPSEKHGLAAGLKVPPERADWTIEQRWHQYSDTEHAVWKRLFERQSRCLQNRACDEFRHGIDRLPIAFDQIPDFNRLSEVLMKATGWQVVAVPGLIPDAVFFEHLAHRRFPAGQFIRKPHELDYLEEPDVFHDVFGHVPLLMLPVMADYMQAYGQGGLRALKLGVLERLARVYWYTVEFGLVQQADGLRIYGAGIASSTTEAVFALQSRSPNRLGFDVQRVLRTRYRIDDFQQTYFVVKTLDELIALATIDFAPHYDAVALQPELDPGQVLATDRVINRGDGTYHALKASHSPAAR